VGQVDAQGNLLIHPMVGIYTSFDCALVTSLHRHGSMSAYSDGAAVPGQAQVRGEEARRVTTAGR